MRVLFFFTNILQVTLPVKGSVYMHFRPHMLVMLFLANPLQVTVIKSNSSYIHSRQHTLSCASECSYCWCCFYAANAVVAALLCRSHAWCRIIVSWASVCFRQPSPLLHSRNANILHCLASVRSYSICYSKRFSTNNYPPLVEVPVKALLVKEY